MSNFKLPSKYHNDNNPPPYTDTGYTPVPKVLGAPDMELGTYEKSQLGKFSAQTNCTSCNLHVTTNVDKKLSSGGWTWAILCCCCGSWLLSLLVLCMDNFWDYIHYCPRCTKKIATYSPEMSCGIKCLLVFASIGIIALQIFIVVIYLLPMMYGEY